MNVRRALLPLAVFLIGLCGFAQEAGALREVSDPNPSASSPDSSANEKFDAIYREVVRRAIDASLADNSAADPDFWSNSRDFCFSQKPSRPGDAEAAKLAGTVGLDHRGRPHGVNPSLAIFDAGTQSGDEQVKSLKRQLVEFRTKTSPTAADAMDLMAAAVPFIRTLEGGAVAKPGRLKIEVPPRSTIEFSYTPHCLQVDAPAVGVIPVKRQHRAVGQNRPVGFYPSSVLIPREAQELYSGVVDYESSHPETRGLVHTLLWGIRGADLEPPPINPTPAQVHLLDAAVPEGAAKYADYVKAARSSKGKPTAATAEGSDRLLTLGAVKSALLQHHLDTITIDHGSANPFNPADTEQILRRLTAPVSLPEFTAQPSDQTGVPGERVIFSAKVAGENLKYQWLRDDKAIKGANADTLEVIASPATVGIYQLIVSTGTVSVKSNRVRLYLGQTANGPSVPPSDLPLASNRPAFNPGAANNDDPFAGTNGSGKDSPAPSDQGGGPGSPESGPPAANNELRPANTGIPPSPSNPVAGDNLASEADGTDLGQGPYSLLAPGVVGSGRQNGLEDGAVTIANTTDQPYEFVPSEWIVATPEPCQPSPVNPANFQRPPAPSQASLDEAASEMDEVARALQEKKGALGSWLLGYSPRDWPFVSGVLQGIYKAVPILGSMLSAYELYTGYDVFTGEPLSYLQRSLDLLGLVPAMGGFIQAAREISVARSALEAAGGASSELAGVSQFLSNWGHATEAIKDIKLPAGNLTVEAAQSLAENGADFEEASEKLAQALAAAQTPEERQSATEQFQRDLARLSGKISGTIIVKFLHH